MEDDGTIQANVPIAERCAGFNSSTQCCNEDSGTSVRRKNKNPSHAFHRSQIHHSVSLDVDRRATAALVSLRCQNLVVVVTETHAGLVPRVEVVLHVDRAAGALVAADGPVLVEGLGSVNGRLLVPRADVQIVCVAVGVDGAPVLGAVTGVVGSQVLNDLGNSMSVNMPRKFRC